MKKFASDYKSQISQLHTHTGTSTLTNRHMNKHTGTSTYAHVHTEAKAYMHTSHHKAVEQGGKYRPFSWLSSWMSLTGLYFC